jgi:hypothetical protein
MSTTTVREKPILFSGPMVRAILDGRKTQTRRIIKPQPVYIESSGRWKWNPTGAVTASREWWEYMDSLSKCPYGTVGDRLWVRETWRPILSGIHAGGFDYRADDPSASGEGFIPWKPSIHMPRRVSRLSLELTDVRAERLHEITAKDILAEGVVERPHQDPHLGKCPISAFDGCCYPDLRSVWAAGWSKINGSDSWTANPWVWVLEFERVLESSSPIG